MGTNTLSICLLLLLSSLSTCWGAERVQALDRVTLQLKWTHAFQFAGYYAAAAKGFYREVGLDVKIVEATPGVDPISNVVEGKAQFGVGTSSLLLERSAGKPVVALAVIFQHSPYVLIARQDSESQGIHDLIGKRIMLEPQSDELLAYLKEEGIPLDRLTRVAHSYDPQDLVTGRVDAIAGYVINQPYYLDRAHFQYQVYTPRSAGIDFYGDNLFTTEQELRLHPAQVKAFRAASLRGWQYAMEHPEEMADLIIAQYSQRHTRDYYLFEARHMVPLLRPELIEIGYMYRGRWKHIAETYAGLGMMKPDFDLRGFLYDPHPSPPDLKWLYGILAVATLLICIVTAIAVYIYRLNVKLRRVDAERKLAEKTLREGENKYRLLIESLNEGIWYIDHNAYTTFVNLHMAEMLGYTVEEMVGKHLFDFMDEKGVEIAKRNLDRRQQGIKEQHEFEFIRKDGRRINVILETAPIVDENGKYLGSVAGIQDITRRKQEQAEKARLEDQLVQAQKMESVGRLAGGVAHDYNNMLGVILGHTELAIEQVDPAQLLFDDLLEIRKAAERSAGLTRQLLAFARKQMIAPKLMNLNEAIHDLIQLLRQMIGEDINLTWLPGDHLWSVRFDSSQVDQILTNLCANSRDAIGGVGQLTIKTSNQIIDQSSGADHESVVPGEYVLLAVMDNGCGMEKAVLDHIFEPFFTTKGVGLGTGLGLSTVYGIVKQNNGFINVFSEPGQGTTVKIYLPRCAGGAEKRVVANMKAVPQAQEETVLLVEDEKSLREICARFLESFGYKTLVAESPEMALDLASRHQCPIDLLLTDVVMPGMNGRDLARKMISLYPHLKCLFISGYAADVLALRGVLDEGMQCLMKPFTRDELARKMHEILGKS